MIEDGQRLWLHPSVLVSDIKHLFEPENVAFQVVLDAGNAKPMFRWRAFPDAPEETLQPSITWWSILNAVAPGKYPTKTGSPVYNHYSLEPNGPTLEQIAYETGAW